MGTTTEGATLRVDTTVRAFAFGAPVMVLLGIAMIAYAAHLGGELVYTLGLPGVFAIGAGVVLGPLRKGLVLDRDARRVTSWWRWLFLYREVSVDVGAQTFIVERTSRHSEEQGTTYLYRILLGEHLLHTVSEHRGDRDGAETLARQMAEHVQSTFGGHRDCREMRRRDALRAKYALVPLGIVAVLTVAAGVAVLVLGR